MNRTESLAKIWETACARVPHWASNTRFGDWAHSFPCYYSHGKVIRVTNPDRSLSLKHLLSFMHRRENVFADLAWRTLDELSRGSQEDRKSSSTWPEAKAGRRPKLGRQFDRATAAWVPRRTLPAARKVASSPASRGAYPSRRPPSCPPLSEPWAFGKVRATARTQSGEPTHTILKQNVKHN